VQVIGGSEVHIGHGLLRKVPEMALAAGIKASRFVIVSDETVFGLYGQTLVDAFVAAGHTPLTFQVKPGENSKCRMYKQQIEDHMLEHRCQRDTCMLPVGGVVGDLTGYVAATYMRGVPVVQVPTSMMAMLDSSVGGKTAINVPSGKNLVGAFHQPRRVTRHCRAVVEGLAEAVKMGCIRHAPLFDLLEGRVEEVVTEAVRLKAEVVALDEKEGGVRSTLNFGHTIGEHHLRLTGSPRRLQRVHDGSMPCPVGHAIEGLASPQLLHGECVSIGCVYEARSFPCACTRHTSPSRRPAVLARDLGQLAPSAVGRISRAYGLPTTCPLKYLRLDELMGKMALDKKNAAGRVRVTILKSIGSSFDHPQPVDTALIRRLLSPSLLVLPPAAPPSGATLALAPSPPPGRAVLVPGSKSISNRVLLMAAMGRGTVAIRGLLQSDDTQVMIAALAAMGAGPFSWLDGGNILQLTGLAGKFAPPTEPLYLGNAGTAARFLTTCATLIHAPGAATTLTGDGRMKQRPIDDLTAALRQCGCSIEHTEPATSPASLPLRVDASGFPGGRIELSGRVELVLKEPPVSQSYIDMTVSLMRSFGVAVERQGALVYKVPRAVYANPASLQVEADASSATYPLAIAAITGGKVTAETVGADSIQGDARFAALLGEMGCAVQQDGTSTTVSGPPPSQRLRAVEVDMEPLTDAFMTAVAVMAVAEGTSRVTGIANQRVKECNRIAVMVSELGKLGIEAGELEDGMWVTGVDPATFAPRPATIACHNDHRIAMSFAVLGARLPGITIGQKDCVDKTFPEFWAVMSSKLGLSYDVPPPEACSSAAAAGASADASIVMVGMRGAGKTHLGESAARALGPQRTVIATGGGIVETAAARAVLAAHWPVVQALKPIEDIEAYLSSDGSRPDLGTPPREVYARRAPWYDEVSDVDVLIAPRESDWGAPQAQLAALLGRVRGTAAAAAAARPYSFFLSLTLPELSADRPLPAAIFEGSDVVEMRVDLLADTSTDAIRRYLALLRKQSGGRPVLYTVRSVGEGGRFGGSTDEYLRLNEVGLRAGCEMLDLEAARDGPPMRDMIARAARLGIGIVGSFHELGPMPSQEGVITALRRCCLGGAAAVAKFVGVASEPSHALLVHSAAAAAELPVPHIALAMGPFGRMSRVLNATLTPVTHPLLPAAAAPGQLSVAEITAVRRSLGYLPSKEFFLFGTPTKHSPSPAIHNAGFEANGCGNTYGTAATVIGAINTLTRAADGRLLADNTDWVGIRNLLAAGLRQRHGGAAPAELCALVLGAGGTARAACHALRQLGAAQLYVFNRTREKAEALGAAFDAVPLSGDLDAAVGGLPQLHLLVSCIPGSAGVAPSDALLRRHSPVVLDAAYRPRDTPLLAAARRVEMLAEQAYAQCETWTGLPAPKRAILKAAAETLRRGGALGLGGASSLLRVRK
ncbi:Pentafunctional AroM protein, partial [Emiliania huxleyi CCMP1516]|uniref:3-phosphoshikimate 1-carboxyvinyltransferase n=2 Tax=Emiliania huxleyi TaxID=2903 RepID=A0A0D3KWS9_EMIH1